MPGSDLPRTTGARVERGVVRVSVVVLATVGLAVAAGIAGLFVLFAHDPRQDIDLRGWVRPEEPWFASVVPGARMATEELCTPDLPCDQALQAETLSMYRFETEDDAAAAARYFAGEAYLSNWVVVRFEPEALSAEQRRDFVYSLDCTNTWSAAGGLDC